MNTFYKYSGAGNDFVLFEDKIPASVVEICHRKRGIGADGVLLLTKKKPSHYQMSIFNADGTEAEMCGNGLRAVFFHLFTQHTNEAPFLVDSLHKTHRGWACEDGEIEIEMGEVEFLAINEIFDGHLCDLINTGVPHLILKGKYSNEIFHKIAPSLRNHPKLQKGANVNLLEKTDNLLKVSTFERGVEEVTEACGTGVTATALSLAREKGLSPPLTLSTPGGDKLTVNWRGAPSFPEQLTLKGKTALVFEGHWL